MNFFKRREKKLIVLDDAFPYLLSAFRIKEYNCYLNKFPHCEVYSSFPDYERVKREYLKYYPDNGKRIFKFEESHRYRGSLIYTIFLNNIYYFHNLIEKNGIPFIFTLYPGGGFWLDIPESDHKLRTVLSSPFFKKVIVTQKITYDYLISHKFCTPDKIEFIYGGVLDSDFYKENLVPKKYYPKDKNTFDICFVSYKYMENGIDKGFDTFIEVAKLLSPYSDDIRFHVVGNYDENDIEIASIKERLTFYGLKYSDFFPKFYSAMDIILSPNVPFKLFPGSFDAFPTGCCVEAAWCGVAVFCTDELKLNLFFENGKDICIIPKEPHQIVHIILDYFNRIDALYSLAETCQKRFLEVIDCKPQLKKRFKIINESI